MFAKVDLLSIRDIVHSEIHEELQPVKKDVITLKNDVKTIKKDVTKVRKNMTTLFDFLDKDYLDLRQRVDRIEEHLGLPPLP